MKLLKPNTIIRKPKDIFRIFAFALLIVSTLINKNEFSPGLKFVIIPATLAIAIFVLYDARHGFCSRHGYYLINVLICVSAVFSTLVSNIPGVKSVIYVIIEFAFWTVLFIFATAHRYERETIKLILDFYALFAVLIAAIVLVNYFTGISEDGRATLKLFGKMKDQNFLAYLFCPIFPYMFMKTLYSDKKLFAGAGIIIVLLVVLLTGSRGSFLSLLLGAFVIFAFILLKKKEKKAIFIVILGAIALLLFSIWGMDLISRMLGAENYSSDVRLYIWKYAIKAFTARPIIGSGIGANEVYALQTGLVTHNTYIQVLGDQGLIGFFAYILLFLLPYLKVRKSERYFIVAYVVSAFAPFMFLSTYNSLSFWLSLIIYCILAEYLSQDSIVHLVKDQTYENMLRRRNSVSNVQHAEFCDEQSPEGNG